MGWLKDQIDKEKYLGRYAGVPAYYHLIGFGNLHDKERGSTGLWQKNCRENLKWLDKHPDKVIGSVDKMPAHENQAIIFVGMSPNIRKSWKYLKNLDERFVIVATNSSAKYLLDRGIKPHYVIALDGRPGSWTLKLGKKAKDIVGIFSTTADPKAMKDWPGKIIVIPYAIGPKSLNRKVEERFGKSFPGGGNAINGAVIVFVYNTQAKIFLFVGNELSFKKKYYADRKCEHDDGAKFYAKDVNGRKVKTLFPLWEYKIWLENLASVLSGEFWFCNCSEGVLGVEVDGSHLPFIGQLSLPDAIEEVKFAWDYEKKPIEERAKIMYDESYKAGVYSPENSVLMWEKLIEQGVQFTKALDVGCGMGIGLKNARDAGYDVWGADLADNTRIWKELGINDYCVVAPAHAMPFKDNEFDYILCTEVMEHIPESQIDDSLQEIRRVGSGDFMFTIALEKEKVPILGFIHTHITIKPLEWWLETLHKNGFTSMKYDDNHIRDYKHLTAKAKKCQQ